MRLPAAERKELVKATLVSGEPRRLMVYPNRFSILPSTAWELRADDMSVAGYATTREEGLEKASLAWRLAWAEHEAAPIS